MQFAKSFQIMHTINKPNSVGISMIDYIISPDIKSPNPYIYYHNWGMVFGTYLTNKVNDVQSQLC